MFKRLCSCLLLFSTKFSSAFFFFPFFFQTWVLRYHKHPTNFHLVISALTGNIIWNESIFIFQGLNGKYIVMPVSTYLCFTSFFWVWISLLLLIFQKHSLLYYNMFPRSYRTTTLSLLHNFSFFSIYFHQLLGNRAKNQLCAYSSLSYMLSTEYWVSLFYPLMPFYYH